MIQPCHQPIPNPFHPKRLLLPGERGFEEALRLAGLTNGGMVNGGHALTDGGVIRVSVTLDLPAPVAFYRMNGTSGSAENDTVGSLNFSDNNSVGSGTGIIGNCRTFNGTNQFLNKTTNSVFQITGAWTAAFWAKPTSLGVGAPIIAKTGNTNFPPSLLEWYFLQRLSDDKASFNVSYNGSNINAVNSNTALSTSAWRLVVGWYDPTVTANGTIYIQVNNDTVVSSPMTGVPHTDTSDVWMGKDHLNFDGWFNGGIDAVGFWNVVLTSTQRTNLYNGGTGREYYSGAWH